MEEVKVVDNFDQERTAKEEAKQLKLKVEQFLMEKNVQLVAKTDMRHLPYSTIYFFSINLYTRKLLGNCAMSISNGETISVYKAEYFKLAKELACKIEYSTVERCW